MVQAPHTSLLNGLQFALRYQAPLKLIHVLFHGGPLGRLWILAEGEDFTNEIGDNFQLIALAPTAMPNMLGVAPVMTIPESLLEKFGGWLLLRGGAKSKNFGVKNVTTQVSDWDAAHSMVECASHSSSGLVVMGNRELRDIRNLV